MTEPGALAPASGLYFDLHLDYPSRQITVEGGFDVACAPNVATAVVALQRVAPGNITIRLDRVTFLDMSGLGILVGARSSQQDRGFDLAVTGVNRQIRRIFVLGGLTDLLGSDDLTVGP
jgi:anti-sigma B factor antagonist